MFLHFDERLHSDEWPVQHAPWLQSLKTVSKA